MNTTTIIYATITANAAVLIFIIRAYMDANKCLQWHQKKHKTLPWVFQEPKACKCRSILNFILFIPKA